MLAAAPDARGREVDARGGDAEEERRLVSRRGLFGIRRQGVREALGAVEEREREVRRVALAPAGPEAVR